MRPHRALSTALGALLLAVAPAACGSKPAASSTPVTVFDVAADPSGNVPVPTSGTITVATLRSTLDALLAAHVTLVARVMHDVATGDAGAAGAARALSANSVSLTGAIATVYGLDAGRAFEQLWEEHTQFFVDYANAARTHDDGARREARDRLTDYQDDFGSFVTTATAHRVELQTIVGLLHQHVDDLTRYIDDDVAGRAAQAAQDLTQATGHMRVIARSVSAAIAAQHLATVRP